MLSIHTEMKIRKLEKYW